MALGPRYDPKWWGLMEAFAQQHGLTEDQTCALHDIICGALTEDSARWLGGEEFASKGGHARALNLTPERRVDIARKAAQTRWRRKFAESDAKSSACATSPSDALKAVDVTSGTTGGE